jgi:hypothetical protein
MRRRALAAVGAAHAPNRVADIIGDQQAALFVDRDPPQRTFIVIAAVEFPPFRLSVFRRWLIH